MLGKPRTEGKIGWCASNFPQEITTTLGIHVVYPENHGAAIGLRAADNGCVNMPRDWVTQRHCSYARINFAYADLGMSGT